MRLMAILLLVFPSLVFSYGGIDTRFGQQGAAERLGSYLNGADRVVAAFKMADGGQLVASEHSEANGSELMLLKLTPTGDIDRSFGVDGMKLLSLARFCPARIEQAVLLNEQQLAVLTRCAEENPRWLSTGWDYSVAVVDVQTSSEFLLALPEVLNNGATRVTHIAADNNNRLYIAYSSGLVQWQASLHIARFFADGRLDESYGKDGIVNIDESVLTESLAADRNGRLAISTYRYASGPFTYLLDEVGNLQEVYDSNAMRMLGVDLWLSPIFFDNAGNLMAGTSFAHYSLIQRFKPAAGVDFSFYQNHWPIRRDFYLYGIDRIFDIVQRADNSYLFCVKMRDGKVRLVHLDNDGHVGTLFENGFMELDTQNANAVVGVKLIALANGNIVTAVSVLTSQNNTEVQVSKIVHTDRSAPLRVESIWHYGSMQDHVKQWHQIVELPDNSFLALGITEDHATVVAKYSANGMIDRQFQNQGWLQLNTSSYDTDKPLMAVSNNGDFWLAIDQSTSASIVAFRANGEKNLQFGRDGYLVLNNTSRAKHFYQRPDGRLRLLVSGSVYDIPVDGAESEITVTRSIMSFDNVLVDGSERIYTAIGRSVYRIGADLVPDATYGSARGELSFIPQDCFIQKITANSDEKVIVQTECGGDEQVMLFQLNDEGFLDEQRWQGGKIMLPYSKLRHSETSVFSHSNGHTFVLANVVLPTHEVRPLIFGFDLDGTLLQRFAEAGQLDAYPFGQRTPLMLNTHDKTFVSGMCYADACLGRFELTSGQLQLSTNQLLFGSISVNRTAEKRILVSNNGSGFVSLKSIHISAPFEFKSSCPTLLYTNEQCEILISVRSSTVGDLSGELIINTDANAQESRVALAVNVKESDESSGGSQHGFLLLILSVLLMCRQCYFRSR